MDGSWLQERVVNVGEDEVNAPVDVLLQPKVEVEEEPEEQGVKIEYSTSESEQNDSEEEELKPLAAVYIKTEVETDDETEEQDPLADYLLADCEDWNKSKPLSESLMLRVKQKAATEPWEEADAGTSNERSEQPVFEETDGADGICRNRAVSQCEVQESSKPQYQDMPAVTNRQPFACTHCPGTIRYINTLEHQRENREEPQLLMCDTCQRQFTARKAHMQEVGKKEIFPCETCGKEFKRVDHLKLHLRMHTGEKPYVCDHCGKCFTCVSTLNVHRRKHTGEQQEMSKCEVCGKSFKTTYMIYHMRTHTEERLYKCSSCEATFIRKSCRRRHEETHSDRKAVQCKVCGKWLLTTSYLKTHMRCHTGEKPYKCGYCEKTFAHLANRRTHEVTHTKKYPYNCAVCGQGKISKGDLTRHLLTHKIQMPNGMRK